MRRILIRNVLVVGFAAVILTLADGTQAADEKSEKKAWKRTRGTIQQISAQRRTVAIQVKKVDTRKKISSVVSQTYKLAHDCTFRTQYNKKAALSDLKVGDEVNVSYDDESGLLIAHRIAHVTPDKTREKSK